MDTATYSIGAAARLSGVGLHTIRAWERRYGALTPGRTGTNRRLYSDADVHRLRLLTRAVGAGHAIRTVAGLPTEDLEQLPGVLGRRPEAEPAAAAVPMAAGYLDDCLEAVRHMAPADLDALLARAGRDLGMGRALEELVAPLLSRLGEEWQAGALRIYHEHAATAVIRTFVGGVVAQVRTAPNAPVLVAATPVGQEHEMGVFLASAAASADGWQAIVLGANLPAAEIAAAARDRGARAVLLSLVYPPDDPRLPSEVMALRRALEPEVAVLVGGRAAAGYREELETQGIEFPRDLRELRGMLEEIRMRGPGHPDVPIEEGPR